MFKFSELIHRIRCDGQLFANRMQGIKDYDRMALLLEIVFGIKHAARLRDECAIPYAGGFTYINADYKNKVYDAKLNLNALYGKGK